MGKDFIQNIALQLPMAVFGKKYHPGIKKLYDKGLISYSQKKKKYIIKRLSSPAIKGAKNKYVSESTMYRIASYLYNKNGTRKKGRKLNTPLSKMYGLQKQRYNYAQKGRTIKEATLLGPKTTKPKTVKRKIKRQVSKRKKPPEFKDKELQELERRGLINRQDFRQWEITRSRESIYPFRAVIRTTYADGTINPRYTFYKPSDVPVKIYNIRKDILIKKVLPLAKMFRNKIGISRRYEFSGTLEFLLVEKGRQTRSGEKQGIPVRIIRTSAKDRTGKLKPRKFFEKLVVDTFEADIIYALNQIADLQKDIFKSEKHFRMVSLTSITVYIMTNTRTAKELKKFVRRVGVYGSK